MDTRTVNVLSLCAGSGALDVGVGLALRSSRTVCFVEHEAYAVACLVARMEEKTLDDAPVWTDLRTFNGRPWDRVVDLVIGGYPCQPFSVAGKRQGADDPRHLWPDVYRIVCETRPRLCFFENVGGHLRLGYFDIVRPDLERAGYRVAQTLVEASEVGAPHKRERLFIMAYCERAELRGRRSDATRAAGTRTGEGSQRQRIRADARQRGVDVADGDGGRRRVEPGAAAERRHTDGSGEGMADSAVGQLSESERRSDRRARARSDGAAMEHAERGRREQRLRPDVGRHDEPVARCDGMEIADVDGLEGREREELARTRDGRQHAATVGSSIFPPGPADVDAWRSIIAGNPALAPAIESDLCVVADGMADILRAAVSERTSALRLTGNGVVPVQAARAFIALAHELEVEGFDLWTAEGSDHGE